MKAADTRRMGLDRAVRTFNFVDENLAGNERSLTLIRADDIRNNAEAQVVQIARTISQQLNDDLQDMRGREDKLWELC